MTNTHAEHDEAWPAVHAAARSAAADIALITDAAQKIIHVSAAFTAMTGYEPSELVGGTCRVLQGSGTDVTTKREIREDLASGGVFEGEILNYRKDGSPFWTVLKIIPVRMGTTGAITHYVSVQRDISNQVALLKQLQDQALYDAQTGLPNRLAAEQAVDDAVRPALHPDLTMAVGLIDLDDFRLVNSALGHPAGDDVLRQWAVRMLSNLRDGDVLARMGGDEFILILKDISRSTADEHLPGILDRVHESVQEPFDVDGQSVSMGMSLGLALVPEDGTDSRSLLRSAEEALYAAKEGRRDRQSWWETAEHHGVDPVAHDSATPDDPGSDDADSSEDHRGALQRGDVLVHLQPVVDLDDGSVHLFEALARLELPDGRIAFPQEFLPHLDTADLRDLFRGVLDRALATLAAWDEVGIHHRVSVNLPPEVLLDPATPGLIQAQLRAHRIEPERLGLELLESGEVNLEEQRATLQELAGLRVGLAMDDLGSGYSNLQRLSSFPFSAIKLDRGLFHHVHDRPVETLSIIATLIQLGRDLEMNVVVEGLEDQGLTEAVAVLGAPLGQGYHLARPMTPDDCLRWLDDFTLAGRLSPISTPIGALAYHWQFARLAAPHPLELDDCPLTRFIDASNASAEVKTLHSRQHHVSHTHPRDSRFFTAWLTRQIREHRPQERADAAPR